ncbi:hypothetical protein LIT97_14840 (plasmid) [Enterococcus faecalis]|uniref:hypothetical protein n=1 Tax=Enterococcus faecalis TaxID=1351 RepID=UPI00156E8851|nr:hypothetical protein [Enterococcus faecalis]NSM94099.1 hypothetical protein [Enterococcus faecalis]UDM48413.1 hypothetical protein LIT97_14840 [Enterococcus faecalis]HAP3327683.1 hypothetical protein [Enterococcus faecalis]
MNKEFTPENMRKLYKKLLSQHGFLTNKFIQNWSKKLSEYVLEEEKNQDKFEYFRLYAPISPEHTIAGYINIDKTKDFIKTCNNSVKNIPISYFFEGNTPPEILSQHMIAYSKITINNKLPIKSEPIIILKNYNNPSIVIDGNTRVSAKLISQTNDTISAYTITEEDLFSHALYLNEYSKNLLMYRYEFVRIYEKIYGNLTYD